MGPASGSSDGPTSAVMVDPTDDPGLAHDSGTAPGIRRMTVDQLDAAVQITAGTDLEGQPIMWTQEYRDEVLNAYDDRVFGEMLGRPDYISSTEEDVSPSPQYIKFSRDMAMAVTNKMIAADLGRAPQDEKTLWRYAPIDGSATDAQISENIRHLVLRYLGLRLDPASPQVVALVQLFEKAVASVDKPELLPHHVSVEGWRNVSVALFEDPAFHLH